MLNQLATGEQAAKSTENGTPREALAANGQARSAPTPAESTFSCGGARPWVSRLAPRDLRRLREAHLAAQRATLESQLAQHRMAVLTLELEWRYGLLGREATVDIRTGAVHLPSQTSSPSPLRGEGTAGGEVNP